MVATAADALQQPLHTILGEVPDRAAVLDVPMTAACGVFAALEDAKLRHCPVLHAGDRIMFVVRPEVGFAVRGADSVDGRRPIAFWPSTQSDAGWPLDWDREPGVWVVPPYVGSRPIGVADVLAAIGRAAASASDALATRLVLDALTWTLAAEELRKHSSPGSPCRACASTCRCPGRDLAINGLHVALGHDNTETAFWHGLTRIRRADGVAA